MDDALLVGLGLVVAAFVLPVVAFLAMGLQNAMVVVFPAWMEYGPSRSQGIEQMGTGMVLMAITALAMLLALLIPVLAGGAAAWRLLPYLGVWSLVPGGLGFRLDF